MIPTIEQFISSVTNGYVVRPSGLIGVGGFVFDILDNEEVSLDAEITDHYVEENYAIQDHIATRPLMFTLRGYIAELRDIQSQTLLPVLTKAQSLASVGGFLPEFSVQATQVYSKIIDVTSQINSVVNQANNIVDLFDMKSTTANNQQRAFQFFQKLFEDRQLCTVDTPFNQFQNMAISGLRAIQRGDTKFISDFAITFKQIRTTVSAQADVPVLAGRAGYANFETVSGGLVSGAVVDTNAQTILESGISI